MNEDDDEFGDSIDWSAIPLNTIGASMAVPTPMGMTSHSVGGNYSSASTNNYHQHQTMTNNSIGGAVPMHHTVGNGATSSTNTATATSIYNNNSVYHQPPQNGQNYSTSMGATNFSTNSVNEYEYGNSNDAEALHRQVSNSIELYKKMTLHI